MKGKQAHDTRRTGSVADSIEPTIKLVIQSHPYGKTYFAVSASKAVLTNTAGPASVKTGVSCWRKRWRSLAKEEPKMRMGRMTFRIASGDKLIHRFEEVLKISLEPVIPTSV
jgi:hypothetical protein